MTTGPLGADTPDASQEVVKLRMPRYIWIGFFAIGGACLVLAGGYLWLWSLDAAGRTVRPPDPARPVAFGVLYLVTGGAWVAVAFYLRSRGTVLTRESVVVRGVRRRSIPWLQVQAVIAVRQGDWHIRLILDSGESVVLRAPRSAVGMGVGKYERDFHRIGQWWLARRGESWRPVRPEAPRLTVQR